MEINKHELYETPEIEVIEIELEYSIAASGLSSRLISGIKFGVKIMKKY